MLIKELQEKILREEITIEEIVAGYLNKIKDSANINAFISLNEMAINEAKEADKRIGMEKKLKPLDGVVFAVKDNILVKGMMATAGSKILKDYSATYDATVIKRIKENGGIVIGKTNMDEFAMGSSNETSYFGLVKNPIDNDRVPGGSSGGSAASVVADLSLVALGSDTAGSIRQPASFCGAVGFKPSYGAVSRFGLIAMCSSLDVIGPITKSVEDCEKIFEIICNRDNYDSTTVDVIDFDKEFDELDLHNITIGVPKEYFVSGINEEVELKVKEFIIKLQEKGCEVKDISLKHTKYSLPAYYIIMPAEVSSNLARFDNVRYGAKLDDLKDLDIKSLKDLYFKTRGDGFGKEVKRRILLGTYVLSKGYYDAYYLRAQKVRTLIRKDFEDAFESVDFIMTPTAPTTAFKLGEKSNDPVSMYLSDIFTVPMNLAGVPAISLPLCKDSNKLPIGIQIVGKRNEDKKLLKISKLFEKLIGYKYE